MTPRSLVRQIGDAGARIWLNGESVRVAANGPLPNAIVEQLRREKPEVVEVLRLLPVCCECGAKVLEPVIAWWGGGPSTSIAASAPGASSGRARRYRQTRGPNSDQLAAPGGPGRHSKESDVMTERTFEQVEAEVEAILDAIRPHLHVGSEEEAGVVAGHVLMAKHPQLAREFGDALRRRVFDQIWIERTRLALENDEEDKEDGRITVEAGGKSIKLPRYIVNPGETDDFLDSIHFDPTEAKVRHHRLHAEWMIRVGSIDAGRDQLALNAELLRRAGGNEDAEIGDLLRTEWHSMH